MDEWIMIWNESVQCGSFWGINNMNRELGIGYIPIDELFWIEVRIHAWYKRYLMCPFENRTVRMNMDCFVQSADVTSCYRWLVVLPQKVLFHLSENDQLVEDFWSPVKPIVYVGENDPWSDLCLPTSPQPIQACWNYGIAIRQIIPIADLYLRKVQMRFNQWITKSK